MVAAYSTNSTYSILVCTSTGISTGSIQYIRTVLISMTRTMCAQEYQARLDLSMAKLQREYVSGQLVQS
jgi:hypothetical protein